MGLSGREVLLILRARDEASRTIGRLSGAMARADRDALRMADRSTKQSRQNLNILGNAAHDVQYNYQRMALDARKAYMESNSSMAVRSKQLQKDMLAAREYRVEQMRQIELNRRAAKEQIDQANQIRQSIDEQNRLRRHAAQQTMATGAAVLTAGASMTYFGVQASRAYIGTIKDAMDYNTEVARTATQVDNVTVNMKKLSDMGKEVADKVPVAFEQIQPALYDIFSSIDVGYKGAQKLLTQFAKDTVGGQTDMETATRANLQIMNAYKISVKDASKVSDFMFQLVRKGVGTYDEFAKTIGRAIPSAARAGQTYQTVGAMMAFMTRNGVSAAMAATSSARALDAISNAGTVAKLKDMGISVKNMKGEFKPLPKILEAIGKKMKNMKGPERAEFLQDLFKGSGGTIQARRFFDMYFKNSKEFNKRNREMQKTAGAAAEAYKRMAESPKAKIQEFQNNLKLLRIEMGEYLLPAVIKVVKWVNKFFDWWNKLDPRVRKGLVLFGAIATILFTIAGVIAVVVGAGMLLVGAISAIGISLGTAAAIAGGAVGIFALIAAVAIAIYKNWDKIKPVLDRVIDGLKSGYGWVKNKFEPAFNEAWDSISSGFDSLISGIEQGWQNFKDSVDVEQIKKDWAGFKDFVEAHSAEIETYITTMGVVIQKTLQVLGVVAQLLGVSWGTTFTGMVRAVIAFSQGVIQFISGTVDYVSGFITLIRGYLNGDWSQIWDGAQQIASGAINMMLGMFLMFGQAPMKIFQAMADGIIGIFQHLYDVLVGHSIVPDLVNAIIMWFAKLPGAVLGKIASLPGSVIGSFGRMATGVIGKANDAWNGITRAFSKGVSRAVAEGKKLPGLVKSGLGNLGGFLKDSGAALVSGFASGIREKANDAYNEAKSMLGKIAGLFPHSPPKEGPLAGKNYTDKSGEALATDFARGISKGTPKAVKAANSLAKAIVKQLDTNDLLTKSNLRSIISGLPGRQKGKAVNHAIAVISGDVKRLNKLGAKLKSVRKQLKDAQDELDKQQSAKESYISNVKSSILQFGSLSSIDRPTDVFGNQGNYTAGYIAQQLQSRLNTIKEFGKNVAAVLKIYGSAIYSDVLQMGPEAGNEYAKALLAATPSEQQTIKASYSGIQTAADAIAKNGGAVMYNAGIATAQGMIKGLQSQEKNLTDAATKLANKIAKAIKKALKIHSPSKITEFLGKMTGMGVWRGLRSQYKDVVREAEAIAKAAAKDPGTINSGLNNSLRPPVVGGPSGSAPPPGPVIHQKVIVNTKEIDPRAHAAQLGWELANRSGL